MVLCLLGQPQGKPLHQSPGSAQLTPSQEMGWFATHPPMQSLAIAAFIVGIVPLQPPPADGATRQSRFNVHQTVVLALGVPALALGTAGMWWNKHVHGAKHFTTWHSWFGLAAVAWLVSLGRGRLRHSSRD